MSSTVSSVPARLGYELQFDRANRRISTLYAGVTIADSQNVIVLKEPRYQPVYYFPQQDVRMDLLVATDHLTHCPFKGNASYWNLVVAGQVGQNVVWSYLDPYPEAEPIKGYLAFYRDRMQGWYEDEQQAFTHSLHQATGHTNPLTNWLLWEAWDAATSNELVMRLVQQLNEQDARLLHAFVVIPTLHPLLAARAYRWKRSTGKVEEFGASHETLTSDAFQNSPLVPVLDGSGGVRRRISAIPEGEDFPIVEDLRREGGTDYVALPMSFSDGKINVISFATDRPEGFSLAILAQIHEILPLLGRLFEVHAKQHTATSLLQTFIGKHTGERVLNGQIKRGDGEDIHAVIWFSDLRGSTVLAQEIPRNEFLDHLNRFFDCIAGAVAENGGEVLRFVGDAVLAIFPIDYAQRDDRHTFASPELACAAAILAVRDARNRIRVNNLQSQENGWKEIGFGIGLHLGDVTYGNIGTEDRLEFTVIGPAANLAARIETMSKTLNSPVVISKDFADAYRTQLIELGEHRLRGVEQPQQLFTLEEDLV